jgi:hypothetical protein
VKNEEFNCHFVKEKKADAVIREKGKEKREKRKEKNSIAFAPLSRKEDMERDNIRKAFHSPP